MAWEGSEVFKALGIRRYVPEIETSGRVGNKESRGGLDKDAVAKKYFEQLNNTEIEFLYTMFQEDFELFGYDVDPKVYRITRCPRESTGD
tara:strand:- start:533 stop:802 length:270 start_codon:yes stop_codon:yes gene_type:complete